MGVAVALLMLFILREVIPMGQFRHTGENMLEYGVPLIVYFT